MKYFFLHTKQRASIIFVLAALCILSGFGCAKGKASLSAQELAGTALSRLGSAEALSLTLDASITPVLDSSSNQANTSPSTVIRYTGVVSKTQQQGAIRVTFWGALLPLTFAADILRVNEKSYLKLTEAPSIPVFDFSDYTDIWYSGDEKTFSDITQTVSNTLDWNLEFFTHPLASNIDLTKSFQITNTGGLEKREHEGQTITERHITAILSDSARDFVLQEIEGRGYDEAQKNEVGTTLQSLVFDVWVDTQTSFPNRVTVVLPQSAIHQGITIGLQFAPTSFSAITDVPSKVEDIQKLVPDEEDLQTLQSLIHTASPL